MGRSTISMAMFQFAFCMFTRPGSKNQTWRAGTLLIPVISELNSHFVTGDVMARPIQHDDAGPMGYTMDTNHFFISIVYESI